jgi:hypothetical protein
MLLEKWYGDAVQAGGVRIDYRAALRFGPASIGYSGCIAATGRTERQFHMAPIALPRLADRRLLWPGGMAWTKARSRPITLHDHRGRLLHWYPCALNSTVVVGSAPAGRGYAECLKLAFAPWHLGLAQLTWGRFCGERHSLAWIEWIGRHPLRLLLIDGVERGLVAADGHRVSADDGSVLRLDAPRLLVDEELASGAVKGIPIPLPAELSRFLRGVERKWLAEAVLRLPGGARDTGHAVFETVRWP